MCRRSPNSSRPPAGWRAALAWTWPSVCLCATPSKLTNLLQELYQPSNANFRHYLTADQFASSFGPSQEDYQAVADFAKSHGLIVKGTHPNRTLLDVSGSVADIEKAFHIQMRVYQHPVEARTFFAPDVEPSLDLATPVLAISGLDNYVRPRPRMQQLEQPSAPAVLPLRGGGGGGGSGGGRATEAPFRAMTSARLMPPASRRTAPDSRWGFLNCQVTIPATSPHTKTKPACPMSP